MKTTQKEAQHTPTPWETHKLNNGGQSINGACRTLNEKRIGEIGCGADKIQEKIDAAYIVKAVNNHEPLLSANREIVNQLENAIGDDTAQWVFDVLKIARAAIAQAEGEII